ncbi:MAG: hypothetical protein FD123_2851 [Bacteroidetes bacterium]|nr:MAG: hypothetical protein FD123_2851 [Bacteroidota bacterium]
MKNHARVLLLSFVLAIFQFVFVSCLGQVSGNRTISDPQLGEIAEVRIKVSDAVNKILDSLKTNKVDTLLVYQMSFEGEANYPLPYLDEYRAKFSKNAVILPLSHAQPAYIFWKKNGHYYVKKIDQFFQYTTIERERHTVFPLFDFYKRERTVLNSEKLFYENRIDSVTGKPYRYAGDFSTDNIYLAHFENNRTSILYRADSVLYSRKLNNYLFQPMVVHSVPSPYPNPIGNDEKNYFNNQSMKFVAWSMLIKSELLNTEMQMLWRRESLSRK